MTSKIHQAGFVVPIIFCGILKEATNTGMVYTVNSTFSGKTVIGRGATTVMVVIGLISKTTSMEDYDASRCISLRSPSVQRETLLCDFSRRTVAHNDEFSKVAFRQKSLAFAN